MARLVLIARTPSSIQTQADLVSVSAVLDVRGSNISLPLSHDLRLDNIDQNRSDDKP